MIMVFALGMSRPDSMIALQTSTLTRFSIKFFVAPFPARAHYGRDIPKGGNPLFQLSLSRFRVARSPP